MARRVGIEKGVRARVVTVESSSAAKRFCVSMAMMWVPVAMWVSTVGGGGGDVGIGIKESGDCGGGKCGGSVTRNVVINRGFCEKRVRG